MWLLMQPRDYLSTFLLISMIVGDVIGVVVANPTMNLPAFARFEVNEKLLFPTLFVTIACGAVSGFHSLVSSETSSKQVRNEKDILPIGFGAMLVESLLGVIALVVVGYAAKGGVMPEGTPFSIFAGNVAVFLKTTNRKGFMLWAPMGIMLCVTFTALVEALIGIFTKLFVTNNFIFLTDGLQLIFAILLIGLGFMVAISCFKKLFGKNENKTLGVEV